MTCLEAKNILKSPISTSQELKYRNRRDFESSLMRAWKWKVGTRCLWVMRSVRVFFPVAVLRSIHLTKITRLEAGPQFLVTVVILYKHILPIWSPDLLSAIQWFFIYFSHVISSSWWEIMFTAARQRICTVYEQVLHAFPWTWIWSHHKNYMRP